MVLLDGCALSRDTRDSVTFHLISALPLGLLSIFYTIRTYQ